MLMKDKPQDDRGVPCTIAQLSCAQIGWRALGLKSVTKDAVIKGEQGVTERRETLVAMIGGFVGYIFWDFTIGTYTKPFLGTWLDFTLNIVFSITVAMILWYSMLGWIRKGRFERISEIYLAHGFCASCGYLLDDLSEESDGCLVCPECNAAWQSSRVKTIDASEEKH